MQRIDHFEHEELEVIFETGLMPSAKEGFLGSIRNMGNEQLAVWPKFKVHQEFLAEGRRS